MADFWSTYEAVGAADRQKAKQRQLEEFIERELPVLASSIEKASTAEELQRNAMGFFQAALKAGMPPQALDKMSDMLIQPARANLGASEFEKIGRSLAPQTQTAVTNTPTAPPPGLASMMGPESAANVTLPFSVEQTQTPGRQFGQQDAMNLAAVTGRMGGNPTQGLAPMLQVPSQVQHQQMQAAAAAAEAEKRREEQKLISQKTSERALLGGEAGTVARADSPSLVSYFDAERDRAQMQPKVESEIDLNRARVGTEGARQGELGTRSQYNVAGVGLRGAQAREAGERARTEGNRRFELGTRSEANAALAELRRRTDPNSRSGGVDANGNPIVTSTEEQRFVNADQQAIDREVITEEIARRGADTPEAQAAIAAEYGYELTGTPTVEKPNSILGALGLGGKPALSGQFSLRPAAKSRSVSKERVVPGGQPVRPTTAPGQQPKTLDRDTAQRLFEEVGGNNAKTPEEIEMYRQKARQLAQQQNYQIPQR